MKHTISAAVAALTLIFGHLAFAEEIADPAQVYGKWTMSLVNNGYHFDMTLDIQAQKTTGTNVCTYAGKSASVSAEVPSEVTPTQIIVKGTAHNVNTVDGLTCNIDFVPAAMSYQVAGQSLTLMAQGQTLVMTRAH